MKARANAVGEVFTLGGLEEGQFYLANVAKIISTVVNGLYSDKIRAPVREYCTNAHDAHLAAGKADEPFLVQLPTRLDPTFRVRDYGLGLDHEGVLRTFTGLGLSTKDTSNDMVGMLGYGSKSGFAYTNGFWVVAHDGRTKRLYDAYMGEDGVPRMKFNGEVPSDEPPGLEVAFAVKSEDIRKFSEAASYTFYGFDPLPTVKGGEGYVAPSETRVILSGQGWRLYEGSREGGRRYNYATQSYDEFKKNPLGRAHAKQGCMLYPIDARALNLPESLVKLLETPIVLDFAIGELNISDSRESLGYDPATVAVLTHRVREVAEDMVKVYQQQIDGQAATLWEAWCLFTEMQNDASISQTIRNLFAGTLTFQGTALTKNLSAQAGQGVEFWHDNLSRLQELVNTHYRDGATSKVISHTRTQFLIEVTEPRLLKAAQRVKVWAHRQPRQSDRYSSERSTFMWIKTPSLDHPSYRALMAGLGHPPVTNLADIEPPAVIRNGTRVRSTAKLRIHEHGGSHWKESFHDPDEGGVYVDLRNGEIRHPEDYALSLAVLDDMITVLKVIGSPLASVLGVPATHKTITEKHDGWTNFFAHFNAAFDEAWDEAEVAEALHYHAWLASDLGRMLQRLELDDLADAPTPKMEMTRAKALRDGYFRRHGRVFEPAGYGESPYGKLRDDLLARHPMLRLMERWNPYSLREEERAILRDYLDLNQPRQALAA